VALAERRFGAGVEENKKGHPFGQPSFKVF
jgi:hypothetical protein